MRKGDTVYSIRWNRLVTITGRHGDIVYFRHPDGYVYSDLVEDLVKVMNEQEWLRSDDPAAMLRHLTHEIVDPAGIRGDYIEREKPLVSDRKLRLYCAASALIAGHKDIVASFFGPDSRDAVIDGGWPEVASNWSILPEFAAERAAALRDIVGNPFRPLPPIHYWEDCGCEDYQGKPLSVCNQCRGQGQYKEKIFWLTPTVIHMALTIYDGKCPDCHGKGERPYPGHYHEVKPCRECKATGTAWHLMPILADALDEAGCTDEEILNHCRGGGLHVKGCWVVDLILGKEQ